MSKNDDKKIYAHGAILRMKLTNFVTYDSLEFSPGSNLNVIIGPNGTGKSSIVCAICLGLGGKPATLGRAANLADYVKYGKEKATIEIELNNQNGKNYVLMRVISQDSKSEWFLNERATKHKEIEELISSLNIQIDNLCQFLPQEKVAEFARLNQFELLASTEKAVGGVEMHENHLKLQDKSKTAKNQEKDLKQSEESLKKEETLNARLESQVKNYIERKSKEQELVWLKRKQSILLYNEKKAELKTISEQRDKFTAELNDFMKKTQPLATKKEEINSKLTKIKEALAKKSKEINDSSNVIKTMQSRLEEYSEKANEIKLDYQEKENQIKQRIKENDELRKMIDQFKAQIEEGESTEKETQQEINVNKEQSKIVRDKTSVLNNKRYEYEQDINKIKSEVDYIRKQRNDMNNVREEKLKKLRQDHPQTSSAVNWLNNNRDKFKGKVYEPMFLDINLKDQSYAKFVEDSIPNKDLLHMFFFENSEDMDFFQKEVRQKMNLVVNSAMIYQGQSSDYKPSVPIEQLKKHGFKSYLRELIDAPEAILVYLCVYYNIHKIPIGNEYTQDNIESIKSAMPADMNRIYTNKNKYIVIKSRYTGKTSTLSSPVEISKWLALSVDKEKLDSLDKKEAELLENYKRLDIMHKECCQEKQELDKKSEQLKNEMTKINEKLHYFVNLKKKLEITRDKLHRNEAESNDSTKDAKSKAKDYYNICKSRATSINNLLDAANKLITLNKDKIFLNYQECQLINEKRKIDLDLREYTARKSELDEQIANIQVQIDALKNEAKTLLHKASQINGVPLINGNQMSLTADHKEQFAKLPESIGEITANIHQAEAIASVSSEVDEKIVEEFNKRNKEIEKLRNEVNKKKEKLENYQQDYEDLKNGWIEKVEEMILNINDKFTELFKQLKCAGEISLSRPDDSDDFAKYGVCIKVSFRSDEKLQELTAWQQSGGEKSVSTMMYMIALQEMTKCPFRVVDEINQGMDPINERKVFDIIVQNSCSKLFAQYFLLTPKLLPDLSFDEKTNVICVFNGPQNLPHSKYNLRKFIEIKRNRGNANPG